MQVQSLVLILGTIAALEILARSGAGVTVPDAVLFVAVTVCAYRGGMSAGLVGAMVAVLYLVTVVLVTDHLDVLRGAAVWRVTLASVVLPGTAFVIGHLRDRYELLLVRERDARAAAEAARERTARILASISDGFIALDHDWRITYINPAAEHLLQRSRVELMGRDLRKELADSLGAIFLQHHEPAPSRQPTSRFEARLPERDVWLEMQLYPSADGLTIYFRDVTERRRHEEQLRSLSLVDELTGLYNRRGFFTLAEQQCKLAERKRRGLLLVFADLDNLKEINDTLGHAMGDRALYEAASILQHTFRDSDIVARLGGDEFAALALETEADTAPILLARLNANIRQRNQEGDIPFALSLSVGTAGFDPTAPCSVDELLTLADRRMYGQKRGKRGD